MKKIRKKRFLNSMFIFFIPGTLYLLVTVIYPLLYSLQLSFTSWNLVRPEIEPSFVGLENFIWVFTQSGFWWNLLRTFYFVVLAISLEILLGFLLALLLNREFYGKKLSRTLLTLPMVMTPGVVGLIWKWIYNPEFGIINYFMSLFGADPVSFLGNPDTAMLALVLVDVWQMTSFMFLMMLAGLQGVPQELYDSSSIDGASGWQRLINVIIPVLKPVILIAAMIRTMEGFRIFDLVYVLTEGGPSNSTEVISLKAYNIAFRQFEMGRAAAYSYVIVGIMIFIGLVYGRYLQKSERLYSG